MDEHRIPKQLMFGELKHGYRDRGRPLKRWKDCAKDDIKCYGIDSSSWYEETADRDKWRHNLRQGKTSSEAQLTARAAQRRQKRQAP